MAANRKISYSRFDSEVRSGWLCSLEERFFKKTFVHRVRAAFSVRMRAVNPDEKVAGRIQNTMLCVGVLLLIHIVRCYLLADGVLMTSLLWWKLYC